MTTGKQLLCLVFATLLSLVLTANSCAVGIDQADDKQVANVLAAAEEAIDAGDYSAASKYVAHIIGRKKGSDMQQSRILFIAGEAENSLNGAKRATTYFDQAIEVCANSEPCVEFVPDLYFRIAKSFHETSDVELKKKYLKEGLVFAKRRANWQSAARLSFTLSEVENNSGNKDGVRKLIEETSHFVTSAVEAGQLPDYELIVSNQIFLAEFEAEAGGTPAAIAAFNHALAFCKKWPACDKQARIQVGLAGVELLNGDMAAAEGGYTRAVDIAKQSKQLDVQAQALSNLATIERNTDRLSNAKNHVEELISTAQLMGSTDLIAMAKADLSLLNAEFDGNYAPAVDKVKELITKQKNDGDYYNLTLSFNELGALYIKQKQFQPALDAYRQSKEMATERRLNCPLISAELGLGDALEHDDLKASKSHYSAALFAAKSPMDDACGKFTAKLGLGRIATTEKNFEEAFALLSDALDFFNKNRMRINQAKSLEALGRLANARHDAESAKRYFYEAVVAYAAAEGAEAQAGKARLRAMPDADNSASGRTRAILAGSMLLLTILATAFFRKKSPHNARPEISSGAWYHYNESDTVFIFVHGILSDSTACWSSEKHTYWPKMVVDDPRFKNPSVYLGGYFTDIGSGEFGIDDAADKLMRDMRSIDTEGRPPALNKKNIIFIAHSTGGLVVRYALLNTAQAFERANLGLFLVASPSRGSDWAAKLRVLHQAFGNRMGGQLEPKRDFVRSLDRRFADLVGKKTLPNLYGMDLFENHSIVRIFKFFTLSTVVTASEAASYFGAFQIIPNTDHFTIAKPTSMQHPSHQTLWDFYSNTFNIDKSRGQS